ncbi:DNA adenine methylase [Sinorhizobium psoraleae]|uniref:DNA adenine methylase n=1 Tax=Sinorhizobium psoraleae TaxID=520838 RepID=UPI0035E3C8F3
MYARAVSGDLVYLDPPFAIRNRRIFYQYRYDDFGLADLARLRRMMRRLDDNGVAFIVSYAASEEADELSTGWRRIEVSRPGNIAGFKANRRLAREVIITNA